MARNKRVVFVFALIILAGSLAFFIKGNKADLGASFLLPKQGELRVAVSQDVPESIVLEIKKAIPNIKVVDFNNTSSQGIALSATSFSGATEISGESLALVSNLKSNLSDIKLGKLKEMLAQEKSGYSIFVPSGEINFIETAVGQKIAGLNQVANWQEVLEKVVANQNNIGFLPLDQVDFRVKSVAIDGANPVKLTGDQNQYPLKMKYFLKINKKTPNSVAVGKNIEGIITPEVGETITLNAVGDIMLSRNVGTKIRESGNKSLPFSQTMDFLKSADITYGNLEAPFSNKGGVVTEGMVFKVDPEYIKGLVDSGFDILQLANNHFGDRGQAGMEFTFNHLKNNNIEYVGAGENLGQAHEPKIIERNGARIAFLAYEDITPPGYAAGGGKPGTAWIETDKIKSDVANAKGQADFVVVGFHYGVEYKDLPSEHQKEVSRAAIDAGADIVLGGHPHVVEPVDFYKGKFIIYSLGNFVFDQMWSETTREGVIAKFYIKKSNVGTKLVAFDLEPVKIYNFNQPKILNKTDGAGIINRILPK